MSKTIFGSLIEPLESLDKDSIYDQFVQYYDNVVFKKIRIQGSYSTYYCLIKSLLGAEYRYLICCIDNDIYPIGHETRLKNLIWSCFQTRSLPDKLELNPQSYAIKKSMLQNKIFIKTRSLKVSEYSTNDVNVPLKISLLHTGKNDTEYEYPNQGTIAAALETFRTIVMFD